MSVKDFAKDVLIELADPAGRGRKSRQDAWEAGYREGYAQAQEDARVKAATGEEADIR